MTRLRQKGLYQPMQNTNSPYSVCSYRYGLDEAQEADLYLPPSMQTPVVCLLHGGFWRMPYGRDQFSEVARDIVARGYAVWNIGYRRLGAPGGGWPGTLNDVASALDYLATLVSTGIELDLDRVVVVGHSAGGHLALWLAGHRQHCDLHLPIHVRPVAAVGLAAIADLAGISELNAGAGAVNDMMGGNPDEFPDRYAAASPIALLPLGIKQLIIHGIDDAALPVELSRSYAAAARASGDDVTYLELADTGHMDFLDPGSHAHVALCDWLARVALK